MIQKEGIEKLIKEEIMAFKSLLPNTLSRIEVRTDQVKKLLQLQHNFDCKSPNYLDVGSGVGILPSVMSRFGWNTYGIDDFRDNPKLIQIANVISKRYNSTISVVSITEGSQLKAFLTDFDDEFFNIISFIDILEHIPNSPKTILQVLWKKLEKGGFFYFEIPNHAMLKNRIKLLAGKTTHPPYEYYWRNTPFRGHFREYTIGDCKELCRFMPALQIRELKTFHKLVHYSEYNRFLTLFYKSLCTFVPNSKDSIRLIIEKTGESK